MTAPSFVSVGTLVNSGFTTPDITIDIPYPASPAAGDLALISLNFTNAAGAAPTITIPAGWAVLTTTTGNASYKSFYYRILTGAETGTVTFILPPGAGNGLGIVSAVMSYWHGPGVATLPYEAVGTNNGASNSLVGTSVTTTGVDRLVVSMFNAYLGFATADQSASAAAGWTNAYDLYDVNGGRAQHRADYRVASSPTTVAAEVVTTPGGIYWGNASFALLPWMGNAVYTPDAGSILIEGATPTFSPPTTFRPASGEVTIHGATPSLVITSQNYIPAAGGLTITGLIPIILNDPALNFDDTVISQYTNSPTLLQLIKNFSDYIAPGKTLGEFYTLVWNIDTAQGYGLDVWGRIVGVGRVLHITGDLTYFGFAEAGDRTGFNQAPFYGGEPLTSNYTLSDQAYRQLILAKALANISDGSIPAINQILLSLFPGMGNCYVADGLDMTMAYTFTFPLDPVQLAIVSNSGVLPKPAGVSASVVVP